MAGRVASLTRRSVAVNFTLPLELLALMDQLAAEAKLSRSEFLRNLIQEALEDAEDLAVSRKRLADEADGWVSLDELRAEAGR